MEGRMKKDGGEAGGEAGGQDIEENGGAEWKGG